MTDADVLRRHDDSRPFLVIVLCGEEASGKTRLRRRNASHPEAVLSLDLSGQAPDSAVAELRAKLRFLRNDSFRETVLLVDGASREARLAIYADAIVNESGMEGSEEYFVTEARLTRVTKRGSAA